MGSPVLLWRGVGGRHVFEGVQYSVGKQWRVDSEWMEVAAGKSTVDPQGLSIPFLSALSLSLTHTHTHTHTVMQGLLCSF